MEHHWELEQKGFTRKELFVRAGSHTELYPPRFSVMPVRLRTEPFGARGAKEVALGKKAVGSGQASVARVTRATMHSRDNRAVLMIWLFHDSPARSRC